MGRVLVLPQALATQQIGGGNATAACGQEDFEPPLGAGSGQAAVIQCSGPFPDGERLEPGGSDGFAICSLWCHDGFHPDDRRHATPGRCARQRQGCRTCYRIARGEAR